ncbi:hypothetical protein EDEG_03176 [Edhazardia aedis USNM 41457]|uniref:Uncharacterized protein n=1 Tax=Edhazardia aedis (strain USNM 41457) TaxID=1003232 RepID=J9DIE1_EDHAE|nr:hypothetical protein EDEG_03176 [Edhazardia aedis USNM 41457]|eukprot:EJW02390.1 hypothetical protein EDEG_03176 [Edhazardia aedis USNM 41457]
MFCSAILFFRQLLASLVLARKKFHTNEFLIFGLTNIFHKIFFWFFYKLYILLLKITKFVCLSDLTNFKMLNPYNLLILITLISIYSLIINRWLIKFVKVFVQTLIKIYDRFLKPYFSIISKILIADILIKILVFFLILIKLINPAIFDIHFQLLYFYKFIVCTCINTFICFRYEKIYICAFISEEKYHKYDLYIL